MKFAPKLKAICLSVFVSILCATFVWGVNYEPFKAINFSSHTLPVKDAASFCVTEDGLFIIPDYEAGDIKIYEIVEENLLNLVTILGTKGYGDDQFIRPTYCYYSKNDNLLGIWDMGLNKIVIYLRIERKEFKKIQEYSCLERGTDFKIDENRLFIAGNKTSEDGKSYDLYSIDLANQNRDNNTFPTTFLLESYLKFGFDSRGKYEQSIYNPELTTIGLGGVLAFNGKDVYFAWIGDLKIFKININSKKIQFFGEKTNKCYVKPFSSEELMKGYRSMDSKTRQIEKEKMSYIRGIYTTSKYVIVVYEGPKNQRNGEKFWMQFYSIFDDRFRFEVPLPRNFDRRMWFDNNRNILYSLSYQETNGENGSNGHKYTILKYRIY